MTKHHDLDIIADMKAPEPDSGLVRTLKDLGAGAAGGVAQVLIGWFGERFRNIIWVSLG